MDKDGKNSIAHPIILVPIAGLILLGGCFMLYFGIYMFIETTFYSTNMGGVPAEAIRLSFAAVLILLYIIVLRSKTSELAKAILLIPPLGLLLIAVILGFYQSLIMMLIGVIAIAGLCGIWIYKSKKSWIYFYAEGLTIAAAIFYALPRG